MPISPKTESKHLPILMLNEEKMAKDNTLDAKADVKASMPAVARMSDLQTGQQ